MRLIRIIAFLLVLAYAPLVFAEQTVLDRFLEDYRGDNLVDDLTKKYYEIWKKAFCEKNSLSGEDYEKSVKLENLTAGVDKPYVELYVLFDFYIYWFKIKISQNMTVKVPADTNEYAYLGISRGVYLSEEEVNRILNVTKYIGIKTLPPRQPLIYETKDEAEQALRQKLKDLGYKYGLNNKREQVIYNDAPHLMMKLPVKSDLCVTGFLNLYSGEFEKTEGVCRKIIN